MLEIYAMSCIQGGGGLEPSFLWNRCSEIYQSFSAVPKFSLVHFSVGSHSLLWCWMLGVPGSGGGFIANAR